jgi:pyruvate ferredoxin oxidoreductase delta subunit
MSSKLAISRPKTGAVGKTGSWRTFRPEIDEELCNKCGNCEKFCPDGVIDREYNIDLDFCKGCGICADVCPKKAIKMVRESK